jgi:hypothetical protein
MSAYFLLINYGGKNLFVFPVDKGKLEFELGRVNIQNSRSALSIQAEHLIALDLGDVNWQFQCSDDAVITEIISLQFCEPKSR